MKTTLIFVLGLMSLCQTERVIYFHNGEAVDPNSFDLSGLRNNPKYVAYDW